MLEALRSFGVARAGAMAGVTAALLGFFLYVTNELTAPPMSLLFSGLDPRDSAEIVAKLDALAVSYRLEGDGTTILVPKDRALRLRMEMAGDGLPSGGSVGYEVFDDQDALGATSFLQNVNMTRALEGELARTIRALDVVDQARVHLVIPKRELFARDTGEPSASIVVRPRGELTRHQVKAIQNLVAAAVEGLLPARVSVIDDKGQLLAGGLGGDGAAGGGSSGEERTTAFEDRLRRQIEEIVSSVVGPGKARVQVTADIDFATVTRESVTFDPDGQVIRSSQSQTTTETASDTAGGTPDTVTVTNSLPDAAGGGDGTQQSSENKATTSESVNYDISSERKTEVQEGGRVRRLSVAVVVDGSYTVAADGTRSYAPRGDDEIKQIAALVRSAIGYDEARGDKLEVLNMRFAEIEVAPLGPEEEPFLGLSKDDLLRLVEMGMLALVAILMILLVFRPLMAKLLAPPAPPAPPQLALPASAPAGDMAAGAAQFQGQLPGQGPGMAMALTGPQGIDPNVMIDIARVQGQVKESSVKKVGEIVANHPDEAMAIMRSWLHEAI